MFGIRAYGHTLIAAFEADRITATCQPGWEDAEDWNCFVADVPDGWVIDYGQGDWYGHRDGSDTFIVRPAIPTQRFNEN